MPLDGLIVLAQLSAKLVTAGIFPGLSFDRFGWVDRVSADGPVGAHQVADLLPSHVLPIFKGGERMAIHLIQNSRVDKEIAR